MKISVSTCFTRELTVLMRGTALARGHKHKHPGAPGFAAWGFSGRLALERCNAHAAIMWLEEELHQE